MNWHKVWTVARHEYVSNVRRIGFIVMTLLLPALMVIALLFVGVTSKNIVRKLALFFASSEKPYAVVDESGIIQELLPNFQKQFVLYTDLQKAIKDANSRKVKAVIRIPVNYVQTGEIDAYAPGGDIVLSTLQESKELRTFLYTHLVAPYTPPELLPRVEKPLVRVRPLLGPKKITPPWATVGRVMVPYFLGMLLVFSIFMSSGYLLQGVAEEKENRLVEIILSSLKTMEWFLGKVIGLGAVGLTQLAIWFLSLLVFSGGVTLAALFLPALPWYFYVLSALYYIGGYFLYAVLNAGLAALGTSARESQQLAGIISFVAVIPFMVSGILFTSPDSLVLRALSYFPLTAPSMMILRLSITTPPWVDVVGSLVSILVSIPIALWLGAKLFRFGILIYGQRPGLRQVWQALRTA